MKMILGPFLFLLFSLHNGGECEAGSITVPIIEHSKNVSSEDITMMSKDGGDDDFVMIADKNLALDPIVVDDELKESEPCPLSHTRGDKEAIHNHGDESSLPSPALLTEEKQETALEKITESISGALSTFKNSVVSIFSPGYGLAAEPGQSEEATNCTTQTNATNTENNNATVVGEHPEDEDHKPKLEDGKEDESSLLIHSDVSSNDTNNSTNATQVTSTTSATTTPAQPEEESESKN